jgi:hypothetical protein
MELTNEQKVIELKAKVYDLLAQMEQHGFAQNQLKEEIGKINQEIGTLLNSKPE